MASKGTTGEIPKREGIERFYGKPIFQIVIDPSLNDEKFKEYLTLVGIANETGYGYNVVQETDPQGGAPYIFVRGKCFCAHLFEDEENGDASRNKEGLMEHLNEARDIQLAEFSKSCSDHLRETTR